MATTIQISNEVKKELDKMKIFDREELNEVTKKEIEESRKMIKTGKFITHEQVKREFGL